ncbi:MAG: tetratricopeptide repeat protein [Congregibacter sp.]
MLRISLLSLLLACYVAYAMPGALAHSPEYFGRKYVLVDEDPAIKPKLDCGGDARVQGQQRATALQEDLEPRQLGEGAYAMGPTDDLGELGGLFADLCNHPAALKNYREALQRMRINEGLLSKGQIPYLNALADSSQAIGDFRSAQLNHRYIFRIHNQGQGPLSAQALDDSLAYFSRARQIFIDPRWRGEVSLFYQAFMDNQTMFEVQAELNQVDYATMEALGLSHLYNLYLLLGTEILQLQPNGPSGASAALHLVNGDHNLAYSKGIRLLDNLLERAADQPAVSRARLYLRLGNWHQWNGKWRRACKMYTQAWLLADGASGAALRQQMSKPAELPEEASLWVSLLRSDVMVKAVVEASFRVSGSGNVSAVDTTRLDEGSSALAGTINRWLRDSHARPAIVDGACVAGELSGRTYRLLR